MLESIVTDPEGNEFIVTHPEGASQKDIIDFFVQSKSPQSLAPDVMDAPDNFGVDFLKGLFTGGGQATVSSAAGLTQWAGQTFGNDSLLTAAEDMREYSQGIGQSIGLDRDFQESFIGQVTQGLGQVPVTIGAGLAGFAVGGPPGALGAAALTTGGQMTSEFLTDMEQSIGKQYTDFDEGEKDAALKGMLAQTALGTTLELVAVGKAVRPLIRKLNKGDGVTAKALRKAIEEDKGALRETLESAGLEGFTEASQGQSLDTLASLLYDEDRELLTMNTLKRRALEFGVGSIVGGTVSGGSQIVGSAGKNSTTEKDLDRPVENRSEVPVPRDIEVTYKPVDGPPVMVTLSIGQDEDALTAAQEILEGRRLPDGDISVTEITQETPIDVVLGESDQEVTQEEVPLGPEPTQPTPEQAPESVSNKTVVQDPEYLSKGKDIRDKMQRGEITFEEAMEQDNALRRKIEARIFGEETATPTPEPTPEPTPAPTPVPGKTVAEYAQDLGITEQEFRAKFPPLAKQADERSAAPDPSVETAPEYEVDQGTGLPSFSLPQNLRSGKPRYKYSEPIKFASDLERAAYSATTSTRDETAKRKRAKYRKILQDAGYSSTEINQMGRELRSQMRNQYDGPGSELSVALPQDIVADASATYIPKRFVGEQAEKAPPFFQSFSPEQYDEGRFVNLETKQDLSDQTFEGGSIRIEGGRPMLETSDNSSQTILNSKASEEGPLVRTNLFKQKAGWKWTQAPEGAPSTIVSVEQGPKHYYTLDFSSSKPLTLKTYPDKKSEPRGRPTTRGKVKLGNPVGEISIRGKKHTVYDQVTVGEDVVAQSAPLTSEQGSVNLTQNERKFFNSFLENQANREELLEEVPSLRINEGRLFIDSSDVDNLNNFISNVGISDGLGTVPPRLKTSQFYQPFLKYEKENTQEQSGTGATSAPAGNRLFSQPLQDATSVSERYQGTQGIRGQEPRRIVELDEERAAVIGKAYDKMKHDPKNPEVVRAYQALVKETLAQYDAILEDGYAMELSDAEYDNSQDMIEDVRNRKVMRVFSTEDGFGTEGITAKERRENPMLAESGRTDKNGKPLLVNDIFRFVHDFFGHGKLGNGFGPLGEENAWNVHSLMFSPLARRALTTETRGQNSWVNFSGVNDKAFEIRNQARQARADGDLKKAKRLAQKAYSSMRFAEQKIGLLPKEFSESNYQEDVTAQAAETAAEDRGPQETFDNINQLEDFISKSFDSIADKMGINIYPSMVGQFVAQYNVSQKIIEYNPRALLNRTKAGVQAAMREEIIHAAMHNVLIQKAKKAKDKRSEDALWVDFFTALGNNLTPQERAEIKAVYQSLQEGNAVAFGSEYSRAVVQKFRYGDFTEQYVAVDKGGPAFQAIVDLLRSVQAYMAKVLGPMVKTNPEAAQVIVDTVDLLDAIDPSIRPKNQQVVANAYDAVDKNAAEESAQPGESADAKASERIREERKWWAETAARQTASKYLTPVITRLNRINPMFGRILQNLDTSIRELSFKQRKQTEAFFNKLNAIKGEQFLELKQLLYFSPTPDEANLPQNKAKIQRRDALLHKYGLLNMYRLDIQPIMEAIYAEYTKLGMPAMGYLEEYFPRVVKDLEGLIKSYGQKTKRTFELLVSEENKRRSKLTKDGLPAPLPPMEKTELARFFQDFLQNKFRVDINGVRLPGNVKARERTLIPRSKLKFYENPGIAFGKYTANMNRAIESFKVVGDTRKGEGRLQGKLGELTEELFSAGQIDLADADELKTLTELVTSQFQNENEILKSLGTITYMATLINPGPVLVQIRDLYKVALYRGLGGAISGTYRTVTGNRRFDLEKDFSIAKTQLSAEFEDPSFLQKALDFGLSRLVPFRQMDVAMKHASIEATYDDFLKKAKSPVGSKKYEQLLNELTITMGRQDALKTIEDLRLDNARDSILVKEALLSELLQRQPLTYLQVPEGYQTNPKSRLFYKLSTFMLLDLNYNRQEFMNDLGGPGKTLKQRTVALRRLMYMATLLTMFGMPSDLLDDWIAGKDTYIPESVMNNILGMFGFSRYTTTRVLEKGPVDAAIQRFTPPVVNIMGQGFLDFKSWVTGDKELFELKSWRNSPLSDVWYNRVGGGEASQERLRNERAKEGIFPSIYR